jgi:hypothetical protein
MTRNEEDQNENGWIYIENKEMKLAKIMLNYGPNGRRRRGRTLKKLLDEAEIGLSRSQRRWMNMTMSITICNT